jgi:hypothetical protein
MVEIYLYGKLRHYVEEPKPGRNVVVRLEPDAEETVASLLGNIGIPTDEVNHIFVNAKLLSTRTAAAALYGYPQSGDTLDDWRLAAPIRNGDRIGVFGRDMAILGM